MSANVSSEKEQMVKSRAIGQKNTYVEKRVYHNVRGVRFTTQSFFDTAAQSQYQIRRY